MRKPKVVLVGKSYVGKTMLLQRLRYDVYIEQPSTVAPQGETIEIDTEHGTLYALLFDTAGSEEYFNITIPFLRDASCALLCFTSENSFESQKEDLEGWLSRVREFSPQCAVLLVLTKTDLLPDDQVTQFSADVEGFIKDNELEGLWATTSLIGTGVPELKEDVILKANGHQLWDPTLPPQPNRGGCKC